MPEILDLGEVAIPWEEKMNLIYEVTYVRTWVRKQRYGQVGKVDGYRVEVTRMNGSIESWQLGSNIGWPTVDGEVVDWKNKWKDEA